MKSLSDNEKNKFYSLRNIGIIAHIDAGKTTLTERFLYHSGKTHKIGDIDEGNTVMDYLDEERSRGITIVAAAASFKWKINQNNYLVHLIDTPGHIDFTAEVERSLRVCDGAVVIFSGVEGVEAQSEKVWHQSDHYDIPKIAFINKLDRLGASFERTVEEIKDKFSDTTVLAMQIPIGIESDFHSVVDLLTMKKIDFKDSNSENIQISEIPDNYMDKSEKAREELVSGLAEFSEIIADLYLNEKTIEHSVLIQEIRKSVLNRDICPVYTGSAKNDIGVQPLLDAAVSFLPSPEDKPDIEIHSAKDRKGGEINLHDKNFTALVFKIVAGTSADLLYLRTYSGQLSVNNIIINPRTGEKTKIKRILRLYAKNIESVDSIGAGDIVGIIGPKNVNTGDTLCSVHKPVLLESIDFPEAVISIAIEQKSGNNRDKLTESLDILCREDPTLHFKKNQNTGQLLLSGMGELHLEINIKRLKDEFNVDARFGSPQVAFREAILEKTETTGVFDRVIGDNEYFAEVDIELSPYENLEKPLIVEEAVKNSYIPEAWKKTAVENAYNSLRTGGNWGYPLIYIRSKITDIRGKSDKTVESAVAGAVIDAVNKAVRKNTQIMEPIMQLDILAPDECIGEITGYLQGKRAVIHGMKSSNKIKHLSSVVPLAEMFGFSKALPKLSGGRGAFSMEPSGYQKIDSSQLEKMHIK